MIQNNKKFAISRKFITDERIKIHVTGKELNTLRFFFLFLPRANLARSVSDFANVKASAVRKTRISISLFYASRDARTRPFRIEGSTHVNRPRYLHNTTVIPLSQSLNVAPCAHICYNVALRDTMRNQNTASTST